MCPAEFAEPMKYGLLVENVSAELGAVERCARIKELFPLRAKEAEVSCARGDISGEE